MAYHLKDRVFLELLFNGKEFPFDQAHTFDFIHMRASAAQGVPYLSLVLRDKSRWLSRSGSLADGTVITIRTSPGSLNSSDIKEYVFRLGAAKEESEGGTTSYRIDGMLNVPLYTTASHRSPERGTSSSVIQRIADQCGMTFEGVGTADEQVWYPANKRNMHFVQFIAERGYAGDNSTMVVGVDLDRTLRYRDVSSMEAIAMRLGIKDVSGATGVPIVDFAPVTTPGFRNIQSGYAGHSIEQSIADTDEARRHMGIGVQLNDGGSLQVNAQVRGALGVAGVSISPIQVGNSHSFAERARYQNERGKALFTSNINVSAMIDTGLRLLDTAFVNMATVTSIDPAAVTHEGLYRVTAKVIYITESSYSEKATLSRRTLNQKLDTAQPDSTQSTRTESIPAAASSTVSLPALDTSKLSSALSNMGTVMTAVAAVATAALSARVAAAQTELNAAPSIDTPLNALLADIVVSRDAGVAAINAIKATDPQDLAGNIPPTVTLYKTEIQTKIDAQTPAIDIAARRTKSIAQATKGVVEGSDSLSSSSSAFSGAQTSVGKAMSALTKNPAFESAATQADATYSNTAQQQATQISQEASAVSANADVQIVKADTYPAIITQAKAQAYAALDAAALL